MIHPLRSCALALSLASGLAWSSRSNQAFAAAPPQGSPEVEPSPAATTAILSGRVRVRGGSRAPVSGAAVIVVDAPADVRPGKPAKLPLDPDAITWMHQAQTDAEGRFVLPSVPVGSLRVVVVAGGYVRLEQWAALERDGSELELYVEPERGGPYRTVVETRRRGSWTEIEAEHTLDGQAARHYPGSGDDPVLVALNLPGVARSPGGLGLASFRGGDPSEVGFYVDGHPVPRAFHIIPIASVLSPPMIAGIELSPGNYAASFGGYGGGLVQIASRPGRRDGVHGEAHLDLFDVGATVEGPIGEGSVNVGIRRSHVGDLLRLVPLPGLTTPNFWDYLTRFDYPLGGGHSIGLRGFGAGDRLLLGDYFDFRASFHRFDFDYRFARRAWQVLVSPSLRLDTTQLEQGPNAFAGRKAQVYSLRAALGWQPLDWVGLDFGADVIVERWRRHQFGQLQIDQNGTIFPGPSNSSHGAQLRFGAWLASPLRMGAWRLVPALRLNVFSRSPKPSVRIDPRLDLRGPLSKRVGLLAAVGMYAIPIAGAHERGSDGAITQGGGIGTSVADIPEYLITYFDPNIDGEVDPRYASATRVIQASLGFEAELPWDVDLRMLGFWRSALAHTFEPEPIDPLEVHNLYPDPDPEPELEDYGRQRALGLELLLRRTLAPGVLDGWLGYTLLWAQVEDQADSWLPAVFDQRHNFVALLSFALPHEIRVGLRFRLGSGNPLTPVTGRDIVPLYPTLTIYRPLRGPRGSEYQPLFHQLDIRIDKTWVRDRASVGVYFDVQNVYNHWYPEFWIYSSDWSARERAIGLPIYPSLGMTVKY